MKKLLALILAAALALSLVACGGGDNSTPEETIMTKEEMEAEARAISDIEEFSKLIDSRTSYRDYNYVEVYAVNAKYNENPLVFVNEFANKPYYITGYVRDITSERFTLKIEDGNIADSDAQITVYPAEQDEILTIKQDDLVTVLGMIVEREGTKNNYICIESAYIT